MDFFESCRALPTGRKISGGAVELDSVACQLANFLKFVLEFPGGKGNLLLPLEVIQKPGHEEAHYDQCGDELPGPNRSGSAGAE